MSRRDLDVALELRWSALAKAAADELDRRRGDRSLELLVERVGLDAETAAVIEEAGAWTDLESVSGRCRTPTLRPVVRYRTGAVELDIDRLTASGDEDRLADMARLGRWAIGIEHGAMLIDSGLLAEAKPESDDLTWERTDEMKPSSPFDTRYWITVAGDRATVRSAAQRVDNDLADGRRVAYALRFTERKPVVFHVAGQWRLVRMDDTRPDDGTEAKVRVCLEAAWATRLRPSEESGLQVVAIGPTDRSRSIPPEPSPFERPGFDVLD